MTITPKDKADIDQCIACMADCLPRLWKEIYEGLKNQGFDGETALDLLKIYIQSGSMAIPQSVPDDE